MDKKLSIRIQFMFVMFAIGMNLGPMPEQPKPKYGGSQGWQTVQPVIHRFPGGLSDNMGAQASKECHNPSGTLVPGHFPGIPESQFTVRGPKPSTARGSTDPAPAQPESPEQDAGQELVPAAAAATSEHEHSPQRPAVLRRGATQAQVVLRESREHEQELQEGLSPESRASESDFCPEEHMCLFCIARDFVYDRKKVQLLVNAGASRHFTNKAILAYEDIDVDADEFRLHYRTLPYRIAYSRRALIDEVLHLLIDKKSKNGLQQAFNAWTRFVQESSHERKIDVLMERLKEAEETAALFSRLANEADEKNKRLIEQAGDFTEHRRSRASETDVRVTEMEAEMKRMQAQMEAERQEMERRMAAMSEEYDKLSKANDDLREKFLQQMDERRTETEGRRSQASKRLEESQAGIEAMLQQAQKEASQSRAQPRVQEPVQEVVPPVVRPDEQDEEQRPNMFRDLAWRISDKVGSVIEMHRAAKAQRIAAQKEAEQQRRDSKRRADEEAALAKRQAEEKRERKESAIRKGAELNKLRQDRAKNRAIRALVHESQKRRAEAEAVQQAEQEAAKREAMRVAQEASQEQIRAVLEGLQNSAVGLGRAVTSIIAAPFGDGGFSKGPTGEHQKQHDHGSEAGEPSPKTPSQVHPEILSGIPSPLRGATRSAPVLLKPALRFEDNEHDEHGEVHAPRPSDASTAAPSTSPVKTPQSKRQYPSKWMGSTPVQVERDFGPRLSSSSSSSSASAASSSSDNPLSLALPFSGSREDVVAPSAGSFAIHDEEYKRLHLLQQVHAVAEDTNGLSRSLVQMSGLVTEMAESTRGINQRLAEMIRILAIHEGARKTTDTEEKAPRKQASNEREPNPGPRYDEIMTDSVGKERAPDTRKQPTWT